MICSCFLSQTHERIHYLMLQSLVAYNKCAVNAILFSIAFGMKTGQKKKNNDSYKIEKKTIHNFSSFSLGVRHWPA